MRHRFTKYQGAGNDFIIIDNREREFEKSEAVIKRLCDRHFGIGADGMILLENDPASDFRMVYYNADGRESSMCGNGGRCIVRYARSLGIIKDTAIFSAIDGLHEAFIESELVKLRMLDVKEIRKIGDDLILDTGSPHYITMRENLDQLKVKEEGAKIRYSDLFSERGINVNFVSQAGPSEFRVRTYERGVEDETLSCGTGVTAVAIAMYFSGLAKDNSVILNTEGGKLRVEFEPENDHFKNVYLIGPAEAVFDGLI
ncbi:MAG: diaminopimelate epimerase [Bacteroidia bacterium]|nr:diaminopimelate epimerase [Bacteroidia bacterium]MBT8267630.1 diaminopimelate epimerase [Bacteroidia bacterium]NNK71175.1 diaminopimelate epimerase [Flavobacteriaceae bacterium]